MCSIGEDDFGDEGGLHTMPMDTSNATEIDLHSAEGTMCKKCNSKPTTVKMKFREAECDDCFLAYVRHKFRATLGSTKILPKNATVLLVFDGSAESIVLLDMLYYAQTQNTFKRLHCSAKILYIDESPLSGSDVPSFTEVRKFLLNYDLKSYVCSIANNESFALEMATVDSSSLLAGTEFSEKLGSIKTLTSKQDYIRKLRYNRIEAAAKQLDCKYIFLSDISTSLAATLLTNISLGRGASTALDVSFLDNRLDDLLIVRPCKDLNEHEVRAYLKVQQLYPLRESRFGQDAGSSASIQNLTEMFVQNLQKDYASTVSTVFRTGDKIAPSLGLEKFKQLTLDGAPVERRTCSFCRSTLDYCDSKTLLAIEFSRLVSANSASTIAENTEELQKQAKQNLHELKELCHGCRNIFHDSTEANVLLE